MRSGLSARGVASWTLPPLAATIDFVLWPTSRTTHRCAADLDRAPVLVVREPQAYARVEVIQIEGGLIPICIDKHAR